MATVATAPAREPSTQELIHEKVLQWLRQQNLPCGDRIDFDASLLDLGIDSLGAATIASELEQATNKAINPEVLYELQTINELAEHLACLRPRPQGEASGGAAGAEQPESPEGAGGHPLPASPGASPIAYYASLNQRVEALKQQGLYFFEPEISAHDGAWVMVNGRRMLMLGSYEYLGLLGDPRLRQAAVAALAQFGTGHHGVRLLTGTTTVHRQLEAKLASFMRAEDALVFSSGYVTNLATISTLVGRGDCVIGDQWNHASIVDGCRMSGAALMEFPHNDMEGLAAALERAGGRRTLVVVDAVYSMDGDIADLPAIVDLCRKYQALLMVDEAHSLGVLGRTGRGIQEHFGLGAEDIDVKMGTLSKTLAGCGGFVAGRRELIIYLRHHARGYIFSGALPASQASVALAALEVVEQSPHLVQRLWENVEFYRGRLQALGFAVGNSVTPIVPVMTGNDGTTLEMTRLCREAGLLVVPVCYPAVPIDAPRLRTCVSAIHSREDLEFAVATLERAGRQTGLIA